MHRLTGLWWSKDGRHIAFEEVDETHIPVYRIMHQGKDQTGPSAQEDHGYPFAGMENARVRLAVVPVRGGDPVWMNLDDDPDIYLARVNWLPDGSLCAQIQNREQTRLDLISFDPSTGDPTTLLSETSDVWINLNDMFRPLDDGQLLYGPPNAPASTTSTSTTPTAASSANSPPATGRWTPSPALTRSAASSTSPAPKTAPPSATCTACPPTAARYKG